KDITNFVQLQTRGATPTAGVLYVKKDGSGTMDGSSWGNALPEVSDALYAAKVNPAIAEVWIAGGAGATFLPGEKVGGNTWRHKTFQLKDNLKVYGGFAGNETDTTRSHGAYPTILSGDLGTSGVATDNAYHVFYNNFTSATTTTVDGVIVTGGNANEGTADFSQGGGMFNRYTDALLQNVIFNNNSAKDGGALYIDVNSSI